jgi:ATP/maltotriose-dependent transcriptional regulator MalT/DNA-binding SARP family transcriptional activator
MRPPTTPAGIVLRPQLGAVLQRGADRPLVSVVAGPGWGKSTLAATWAADREAAWYRVDAADGDAHTLAAGLAGAVDGTGTGAPRGAGVSGELAIPPEVSPAEVAAHLLERWGPSTPVRLVIDDIHLLGDTTGAELLRALAAAAGPGVQLMMLAAHDVGLVDARQRGSGAILELDATHLALDAESVAVLLDLEFGPDAGEQSDADPGAVTDLGSDAALAARIVGATGGWPAGVRLVIEALRASPKDARTAQVASVTGPGGSIAAYLLAVVLPTLDRATRRTLLHTALLGSTSAELLAALAGDAPVETSLRIQDLVRRGLLHREVSEAGDELTVAPVLGQVLLAWEDPADDTREPLVGELVDGLLRHGHGGRALDVVAATGRASDAVRILEDRGDELLRRGEVLAIDRAASTIPSDLRTSSVARLQGHALAYRGDWSSALASLTAAGVTADGELPAELALPLGLAQHLRGDLDAALAAYARGPEVGDDVTSTVLGSWRATCHWLRGELEDARRFADAALAAAERLTDEHALAHAHTAQALLAASDGDRRANAAHYRQALTAAQRAGDRLQQARILTNLGSHHLENGRYDEARLETDRAIDLASALGYAPILGVAWCNRAELGLQTGALDQAIADATTARELFARIGSHNESYAEHLLGYARREQGELVLARVAYERAIRLAAPTGDHQGLVPAHVGLAKILASTDPEEAAAVAARALELDGGMGRAAALVAGAWVELARGDHTRARQLAVEAREDAERREDPVVVAEAVTCLALLDADPTAGLREALQRWRDVDAPIAAARVELGLARRSDRADERARAPGLERRLQGWGCPPDGGAFPHRAVAAGELRPRTTIRVLGGFVVERGGRPVPRSVWGSRKARDLLKVLVVRGGRRITREQLADLLWPDEPYDEVTNRLSVALSVVRGVLNPDDAPREASPIRSVDDGVELDADAVDVDLVRFEELADEGLRAVRSGDTDAASTLLSAAEESYGGDLLEDDLEASWVVDRREELRARYVAVARTLAGLVVASDPDHALRLLLRVLDRDGYDEPAHLAVCRTLVRAGRHGEARRRHHIYTERMAELGLPAVSFHEVSRGVLALAGAEASAHEPVGSR